MNVFFFAETKEITKVVPKRMCFMNDIKEFTDRLALYLRTKNMSIFAEFMKATSKIQGNGGSGSLLHCNTVRGKAFKILNIKAILSKTKYDQVQCTWLYIQV